MEQTQRWPFWWRWVVATNLGWFPGILLGYLASSLLPTSATLARACTTAAIAALFVGGAQAVVLRKFLPRIRGWWLATFVGWTLGVGLAELILGTSMPPLSPFLRTVAVAFIAGAVVGLPQAWALMTYTPQWVWWPAVSAIGWGILFPGAFPGFAIVRAVAR